MIDIVIILGKSCSFLPCNHTNSSTVGLIVYLENGIIQKKASLLQCKKTKRRVKYLNKVFLILVASMCFGFNIIGNFPFTGNTYQIAIHLLAYIFMYLPGMFSIFVHVQCHETLWIDFELNYKP